MNAVDLLKRFEGFREHAYQDTGGVWTVGYGFTGPDVVEGSTVTREAADERLSHLVELLQGQVSTLLSHPPTPNELAAMVSLAYNIGIGAFRERCSVLRHFNARATGLAANAFLLWTNVKGHPDQGLIKRRHEERRIFLGEK